MDRLELVEIIHDATPVEADGGVPDVCNRMTEHEAVADAIKAHYDRPSQELATLGGERLRTVVKPAVIRSCFAGDPHRFIAMDGLLFCSRCGRGPVEDPV